MRDHEDFRPSMPYQPGLPGLPAGPQELADRGSRLGAKCLDYLAFLAVLLAVGLIAAFVLPAAILAHRAGFAWSAVPFAPALVLAMLAGVAGLVVWNCVWLDRYGQTIGKRAVGIRIVRASGEPASLGRILGLRYLPMVLLGALPYLGPLISLADILLIFRDSRQCLHDQIADTKVVKA